MVVDDSKAERSPSVHMRWDNLLFLHWPVDPLVIRPLIPAELELDLFNDRAWIALVPFRMEATRFRHYPPLPGLSSFYECNVRTYVRAKNAKGNDIPGVWFFSLDAERLLPVLGGNWLWSLNYIHSRFTVERDPADGTTDYSLARRARPFRAHTSSIRWTPGQPLPRAIPGSLEHFLTERYWLFTRRPNRSSGRIMGGRIEHDPWSLRRATVSHLDDTLIRAAGVNLSSEDLAKPLAWHSDTLSVRGWNLLPISRVP